MVLRFWDVPSERLCKDRTNGRAGFRNLVFHRNSRAGKNVLAWHIACLVFLKGEPRVGKIVFGCTRECEQKGSGLLCPLKSRV